MLIIVNFCLTERCGRNVVFLEMENTSVQVIVILLILIFESPRKMLDRRCSKSSQENVWRHVTYVWVRAFINFFQQL